MATLFADDPEEPELPKGRLVALLFADVVDTDWKRNRPYFGGPKAVAEQKLNFSLNPHLALTYDRDDWNELLDLASAEVSRLFDSGYGKFHAVIVGTEEPCFTVQDVRGTIHRNLSFENIRDRYRYINGWAESDHIIRWVKS